MSKKKYLLKICKIFFINSLFLFLGLIFIEIFFKIANKKPLIKLHKYPIPKLLCNSKITFDVSHLYDQNKKITSEYIRNKKCYRSYNETSNAPKILTIGGSTTDQRYITEGKTFQDILDKKFKNKFDFINGGVDGQSTSGHLFSIVEWHSRELDKKVIKEIIFYIGINDQNNFLKENFYVNYSLKRKLFDFFQENSYLFRFIKGSFKSKQIPNNLNVLASHNKSFEFKDSQEISFIDKNTNHKIYQKGIKDLILITLAKFPFSSIKVIQQQIPGCIFINELSFIDRHGKDSKYCEKIGTVYQNIDKALESLNYQEKSRLTLHKMYLKNIIEDSDVYDAVHTNESGSQKIADYIETLFDE